MRVPAVGQLAIAPLPCLGEAEAPYGRGERVERRDRVVHLADPHPAEDGEEAEEMAAKGDKSAEERLKIADEVDNLLENRFGDGGDA